MKIKFKAMGKRWTLAVMGNKEYRRKNGGGTHGITHPKKRRVDLAPSGCNRVTIWHELVHVYLSELCHHSANLDDDDLEEIFAELFCRRGKEIIKLGKKLARKVKKGRR